MAIALTAQGRSLSERELADYRSTGFHIARGLIPPDEVVALAQEAGRLRALEHLIRRDNLRCRFQPDIDSPEAVFECFDPIVDLSPLFLEYSRDCRILDMMRSLYGGDEPHLCHNQFIYKPPRSKGYSLHQDYVGWPIFPRSFHTVAIAIDPHDAQTGCIEAWSGEHGRGLLMPDDGQTHEISEELLDPNTLVRFELEPGDAAIFGCLLPHRSAPNLSHSSSRRTLFFCYNAASDGGDMRLRYYDYYRQWLTERYASHGKTNVYFE
jgi:hypothetical protein